MFLTTLFTFHATKYVFRIRTSLNPVRILVDPPGFEPGTYRFWFVLLSQLPGLYHHPRLYVRVPGANEVLRTKRCTPSSLCTFQPRLAGLAQDYRQLYLLRLP